MPARIIIGADLVPTEKNYQYFKEGDAETLIGIELLRKLNSVDFTIFNLEVPLTNKKQPIEKCGPNLIASIDTIKGLKIINSNFFTLANNHILDQGKQGLDSTIEVLKQAGIAYAGAGSNLEEARKPYIIELDEIKVGIYCCAEHEFSIATDSKAGANPFDPLESLDHIAKLKGQCEYVIVLYHGGKEHYRYPSPYLQKKCRKLVEKGADLVVCQHSHCIGCKEEWENGTIVYGQGNFLFDNSESEYWQTSLLIDLTINHGSSVIDFLPIYKDKEKVRMAQKKESDLILKEFFERSEEIQQKDFIFENYAKFAQKMCTDYLNTFMGKTAKNPLYRLLNKVSGYRFSAWYQRKKYRKRELLSLKNRVECEAHRELILQILSNEGYNV